MGGLTRRLMIGSAGAVVIVSGASWLACRSGGAVTAELRQIDVLLDGMIGPARIGRAMRAGYDDDQMVGLALDLPHVRAAMGIGCASTRLGLLRAATRQEFTAGQIVLCDRLVVSRTEALVAGLFAADGRRGDSGAV